MRARRWEKRLAGGLLETAARAAAPRHPLCERGPPPRIFVGPPPRARPPWAGRRAVGGDEPRRTRAPGRLPWQQASPARRDLTIGRGPPALPRPCRRPGRALALGRSQAHGLHTRCPAAPGACWPALPTRTPTPRLAAQAGLGAKGRVWDPRPSPPPREEAHRAMTPLAPDPRATKEVGSLLLFASSLSLDFLFSTSYPPPF